MPNPVNDEPMGWTPVEPKPWVPTLVPKRLFPKLPIVGAVLAPKPKPPPNPLPAGTFCNGFWPRPKPVLVWPNKGPEVAPVPKLKPVAAAGAPNKLVPVLGWLKPNDPMPVALAVPKPKGFLAVRLLVAGWPNSVVPAEDVVPRLPNAVGWLFKPVPKPKPVDVPEEHLKYLKRP